MTTLSLLPMEIQIGDTLTDQKFEWQVLTRPVALHDGKRGHHAAEGRRDDNRLPA
jgi:hypothetical protein